MDLTIAELVESVGGRLISGDAGKLITSFAALGDATSDQVSFFAGEKFGDALAGTSAGLVVVSEDLLGLVPADLPSAIAAVGDAAVIFDKIVGEYGQKPPAFVPGIANGAHVDTTVEIDPGVSSVLPGAVVLAGAKVGRGTRISSGAVVGERVQIGEDCEIGPNVTLCEGCILGDRVIIHGGTVIGADGFGYEFEAGRHRKVEQLGIVRIEDDVEIGASTTVDRARFGETIIGEGTKIDNQVQIGHNVVIGKHCIIVAQTGISGSAKLGNYVTLAARVGVAGHIEIADQTTVGGKSGVIASIKEPGGTYFGYPAKPMKDTLRARKNLKQLGSLIKRVKELEKKLEALDEDK